jgi:uncharacterized protein (DUF58 family)
MRERNTQANRPRVGRSRARDIAESVRKARGLSPGALDEALLNRRPLYYAAGLLALLSFALLQPLLFVGAMLVFLIAFIPEIWYRYAMTELTLERTPARRSAMLGDEVEITLTLENRKPLPLPWVQFEESLSADLPINGASLGPSARLGRVSLTQTFSLWSYQRVRRRYTVQAIQRGAYRFSTVTLRASDPFGMMTREVTRELPATLLVQPLVAPIERFGLPAHAPFGESKSARRLLEDPLRVIGTREYMPGDEPRRIHWKATARSGTLQSKVFEPSTRYSLVVFLDVRTFPRAVKGYDPDLADLAISATASAAHWGLSHGYAVGVISNGTLAVTDDADPTVRAIRARHESDVVDEPLFATSGYTYSSPRLRLAPSARGEQLPLILDGLARLQAFIGVSMDQLLLAEQRRLSLGATIVYIGCESAVDVPVVLALRNLRRHGHDVSLLLTQSLEPGTLADDGALHLADLPVHHIGGRDDWRALVAEALGARAPTAQRQPDQPPKPSIYTFSDAPLTAATNGTEDDATSATSDGKRIRQVKRPIVVR